MGTSAGNAAARVCVGLLVAALHLVVLKIALNARWNRPNTAADSRALTLVNVDESKRDLRAVAPKQTVPEPTRTPPLSVAPIAPVPATSEDVATTERAAIQDWRGSMEAAATAAVGKAIRDGSYRALGPVERERSGSASAPSIFEAPRRKAGDIDNDAVQGRTLIWHNEHCYTELRFPTIKDPNALVGAPNPPKCMQQFGEREARGDLFESIGKSKRKLIPEVTEPPRRPTDASPPALSPQP
ncbi:MAG TPA: hypothetical protein VGD45_21915 [Steroidobacter sp.]|uniref:hypothetical protein n=1 Tax=Steroidobacter sp. TaxID=1978227 RepID=UPI002ED940A8